MSLYFNCVKWVTNKTAYFGETWTHRLKLRLEFASLCIIWFLVASLPEFILIFEFFYQIQADLDRVFSSLDQSERAGMLI